MIKAISSWEISLLELVAEVGNDLSIVLVVSELVRAFDMERKLRQ